MTEDSRNVRGYGSFPEGSEPTEQVAARIAAADPSADQPASPSSAHPSIPIQHPAPSAGRPSNPWSAPPRDPHAPPPEPEQVAPVDTYSMSAGSAERPAMRSRPETSPGPYFAPRSPAPAPTPTPTEANSPWAADPAEAGASWATDPAKADSSRVADLAQTGSSWATDSAETGSSRVADPAQADSSWAAEPTDNENSRAGEADASWAAETNAPAPATEAPYDDLDAWDPQSIEPPPSGPAAPIPASGAPYDPWDPYAPPPPTIEDRPSSALYPALSDSGLYTPAVNKADPNFYAPAAETADPGYYGPAADTADPGYYGAAADAADPGFRSPAANTADPGYYAPAANKADPYGLPATPTPRIEPTPPPPPRPAKLLTGLLVGLLAGLLLFGAAGVLVGRTTAPQPEPPKPPTPTQSLFEQTQAALNRPKFANTGLLPLSQGWLPYLSTCARATAKADDGESVRIRCTVSGMSALFVEYKTTADRDKARGDLKKQAEDARTLTPGAGQNAPKTSGNYVEYAYPLTEGGVTRTVAGIWWEDPQAPAAAYVLAYWKDGLGERWEPMRDLWSRYA
ncbi:hypothetical protein ACQPZX_42120 [Actinoplanes sp. CA-142083]|uniref:hypothetical protein n=1 Tax=Actinoplanes sp. CA-142083 TaxID=3239903 RepID=UPI003D923013